MRLLLAAALVSAAPAVAQSNRFTLPVAQSRMLVESYADCVVRYDGAKVRAAVRAYLAGRDADFPLVHICARTPSDGTEITFTPDVYRYAMAEALYTADYGKKPATAFDSVTMSGPPEVAAIDPAMLSGDARRAQATREAYDHAVKSRYMLIVGDCIVRTDLSATRALVTSKVESKEEGIAFGAIKPVLAQCLPEGQRVQFNRTSLRGILALSAYRLSDAAAAVATGKDKPGA